MGAKANWEVGEVIGQAWRIVQQHWAVLIFAPLLALLGMVVLGGAVQGLTAVIIKESAEVGRVVAVAGFLFQYAAQAFLSVGTIRLGVSAARGERPDFGIVFSGADRMFSMLGVYILLGLAVGLGFILLIVPGVILLFGFYLATYFCVDQKASPVDALKQSWEAMKGEKLKIFLFFLVVALMFFVGLLACGVGVLVAMAIANVALGIIYTRLSGTSPAPPAAPPAWGAYGAGGAPPGGYGGGTPPAGGAYGGGGYGGGGYGGGGAPPGGYGGGTPPAS
jgi:hypothetical protein